jgi:hypothetical protein
MYSLVDCSIIVYNNVVSLTHYYNHYLLIYVAIQYHYIVYNIIKVAFRMQSRIGWEIFTKGRVSREWVDIMERHYKNDGLKLTGTECVTKIIMALWDNLQRI